MATSSSPNNLQTIHCGTVVNAAGPSAGYLAKKIGIHLPVEPRKRFIFVLDGAEASKINEMPFVIDCSGIGLTGRLEGFACGMSPTLVSICGINCFSFLLVLLNSTMSLMHKSFRQLRRIGDVRILRIEMEETYNGGAGGKTP